MVDKVSPKGVGEYENIRKDDGGIKWVSIEGL